MCRVGLLVVIVTTALSTSACTDTLANDDESTCKNRTIVIDGSASSRGDDQQDLAADIAGSVAVSATICETSARVLVVSGFGSASHVLHPTDVDGTLLVGPTSTVRESRLTDAAASEVQALINERLRHAYREVPQDVSSMAAMLQAAADNSEPDSHVIVLTDGVNQDASLNLNRPLAGGDGRRHGERLNVPELDVAQISFIGVGNVDSQSIVPDPQWSIEIRQFVQTICERIRTPQCEVRGSTSPTDVLR